MRVSFLGAGAFTKGVLLPALARRRDVQFRHVAATTGPGALRVAEQYGFEACGTDPARVIEDPEGDLVFIATRHDSHAALASAALRAGKAVWLEKPVGLSIQEVDDVLGAAHDTGTFLTVGYNRRFSPHAIALRDAFADRTGPIAIRYAVAAGPPPRGTWLLDPGVGGGRIVGEACHFVDLCTFLVGRKPVAVFAHSLGRDLEHDDSMVLTLTYPEGSIATVEYLAGTGPDVPKERIEVSGGGRTGWIDNYRSTRVDGRRLVRTVNQDKGHSAALAAALEGMKSGTASPFGHEELRRVSLATLAAIESSRTGKVVSLVEEVVSEQRDT